jgi:naphthalene 1,2-dioxygenase system ferredoxin subunit
MTESSRWVEAALLEDCPEGDVTGVELQGHEIAIYHLENGELYASSNVCTHGQAHLSDGWLVDDCLVECPLHAGCFDIRTGKGMGSPIQEDLKTYGVRKEGKWVLIELVP